jgi:type IV pilus assembly protein PilM
VKYLDKILQKTNYSSIGLEIGEDCIRMIQLKSNNGQWSLHSLLQEEFSSQEGNPDENHAMLVSLVKGLLKKQSLHGRTVVSALSNRDVDILPVRLKLENEHELEAKILEQASARLSYDVGNAVIDYLPIDALQDSRDEGKPFWIIATQRSLLDQHLSLLKDTGLQSNAIDIQPCALVRAVLMSGHAMDEKSLLIHVGDRDSILMLLEKAGPIAERVFLKGYQDMVAKIQNTLKLDKRSAAGLLVDHGFKDESSEEMGNRAPRSDDIGNTVHEVILPIFNEIFESLRDFCNYCYAEIRDVTIERIYLTGKASLVCNIDRLVEKTTEIKTEILDPLKSFCADGKTLPDMQTKHGGLFSVPLGLCLRQT